MILWGGISKLKKNSTKNRSACLLLLHRMRISERNWKISLRLYRISMTSIRKRQINLKHNSPKQLEIRRMI